MQLQPSTSPALLHRASFTQGCFRYIPVNMSRKSRRCVVADDREVFRQPYVIRAIFLGCLRRTYDDQVYGFHRHDV